MTRGQLVTFLWKASGSPEPKGTDLPFTDLEENAFYYKAVQWAFENGVTAGVSEGHFAPDQTVARAQAVTFAWAYSKGITAGTSAAKFSPGLDCLRGEIVTMMYNYFVK